jgi:regulator of sigma E protease
VTYVIACLVLGVLVLVHEAGHFLVARALGLPVARFSVGFGRQLWAVRRGTTEYRLSTIPLGGYVLLDLPDTPAYFAVPLGKRIAFALGGPLANLLLPIPLLMLAGPSSLPSAIAHTLDVATRVLGGFVVLFSRPDALSGVIGIVSEGGRHAAAGSGALLLFASVLSVNLGIFNLLPLPGLDGGKIALDLAERLDARMRRLVEPITVGGFLLLLVVLLYATALDLYRFVS